MNFTRVFGLSLLPAIFLCSAFASTAWAIPGLPITVTVNTLADEDDGVNVGGVSLRDAINATANRPGSVIQFTAHGTIMLTADLPVLFSDVTITADDAGQDVTIDGASQYRGFTVLGGNVTLRNIHIINCMARGGNGGSANEGGGGGGAAGMGAALFINDGHVRCERCQFLNNFAQGGNGGFASVAGTGSAGGGGGGVGGAGADSSGTTGGVGGSGGWLASQAGVGGDGGDSTMPPQGGGAGLFGAGGGGGGGLFAPVPAGAGGAGGFGGGGGGGGLSIITISSGGLPGAFGGIGAASRNVPSFAAGGGGGGGGLGGAIFIRAGDLVMLACDMEGNVAAGGAGLGVGSGNGLGKGGALFLHPGSEVKTSRCTFSGNFAGDSGSTPLDDFDVFSAGILTTFPTVESFSLAPGAPPASATQSFNLVFSEPVTGIDATDFVLHTSGNVNGAAITSVADQSGSGTAFVVTVNVGTSEGAIAIELLDDDSIVGSTDPLGLAGAGNGDALSQGVFVDTIAPVVTSITATTPTPTHGTEAEFAVNFSETVSGLMPDHVNVTASGVGVGATSVTPSGSGFIVRVADVVGAGNVKISIAADAVVDTANNKNAASADSSAIVFDQTVPTVSFALSTTGPTNATSFSYGVNFSEAVTGFDDPSDITLTGNGVSNSGLSIVKVDSSHYTVNVTGISGSGELQLSVTPDVAMDAAGNQCAGGTAPTVTFDHDAPRILSIMPSATSLTDEDQIEFTIEFSKPITGFGDDGDVTLTHVGTTGGIVTIRQIDVTHFVVTVTGISGEGTFGIIIPKGVFTDVLGTPNAADQSISITRTPTAAGAGPVGQMTPTACGAGTCGALGPSPLLILLLLVGPRGITKRPTRATTKK